MDYQIEQWINGPAGHHAALDTLMRDAANWAVPIFIGIVAVWFVIGWIIGRPEERRGAVLALLGAGGALLVNQVVIRLWDRPRPFVVHPQTVHVLVSRSSDASFPSDHAAASIAIAVAVLLMHRRLGLVILAVAVLVCYSRVFVGAHYPGDVVGGALIGLIATLILWRPLAFIPTKVNDALTWIIHRLHLPLRDQAIEQRLTA
jgi:undecaprenyl-diphosphatase